MLHTAMECATLQTSTREQRTMNNALTNEQAAAIQRFAKEHGRSWKSDLLDAWRRNRCNDHVLVEIRNTFGPSWLAKYRPA